MTTTRQVMRRELDFNLIAAWDGTSGVAFEPAVVGIVLIGGSICSRVW